MRIKEHHQPKSVTEKGHSSPVSSVFPSMAKLYVSYPPPQMRSLPSSTQHPHLLVQKRKGIG